MNSYIYPIYLKSDKESEKNVLAIKFVGEYDYIYYYTNEEPRACKNGFFNVEKLKKDYDYQIISKEKFDDIIPPQYTYPVYLHSKKESERGILAIEFLGKRDYIYYYQNGTKFVYNDGHYDVTTDLMKHFGYQLISKEKFNKLIKPLPIIKDEPKAIQQTTITLNNQIIQINGISYKLVQI
jgi:hypothetical protein